MLDIIPGIAQIRLFFNTYRILFDLILIVAIIFGPYFYGRFTENKIWEAREKAQEEQVMAAIAKSKPITEKIVTQLVTKKQIIKQKGDDVISYIDREVVKYDTTCLIKAHNAAALNETVEEVLMDAAPHNEAAKTPMILPKK